MKNHFSWKKWLDYNLINETLNYIPKKKEKKCETVFFLQKMRKHINRFTPNSNNDGEKQ